MFERFTERARQVVVLAQEEARALGHNYIGTEHLLLGLMREQDGIAAGVLESLGVEIESARAHVVRLVGSSGEVVSGQIPFTPRAKKTLELAGREALSRRHDYIGTEHILLAVVRTNEGVAARILLAFEVDQEAIRQAVLGLLSGSEAGREQGGNEHGDSDQDSRHAPVPSASASQFTFAAGPNHELQRLLMAAAGRALADQRSEFGLDDLLAAAAERTDQQQ